MDADSELQKTPDFPNNKALGKSETKSGTRLGSDTSRLRGDIPHDNAADGSRSCQAAECDENFDVA